MELKTDFTENGVTDPAPMHPAAFWLKYDNRADGWTPGRRAAFLTHLADHGIVADAAAVVGKSVSSAYALRRRAGGYAFSLGWEAALIIARRRVIDALTASAIEGEKAVWTREEGKTTYTRFNPRTAMALLDRVNPATSLNEVLVFLTNFDLFCEVIEARGNLWEHFDFLLEKNDFDTRNRVRHSLQLSDESADFDEEPSDQRTFEDEHPIEYKSMPMGEGAQYPPRRPVPDTGLGYSPPLEAARSLTPCQARGDVAQGDEGEGNDAQGDDLWRHMTRNVDFKRALLSSTRLTPDRRHNLRRTSGAIHAAHPRRDPPGSLHHHRMDDRFTGNPH
jgi:hypothetical protein